MKNNFFPYLSISEMMSIKKVCNQYGFRFIYNRVRKESYLVDSDDNVHGNVSFWHGHVMVKIGHVLVSIFRYIKLSNVFKKIFTRDLLQTTPDYNFQLF